MFRTVRDLYLIHEQPRTLPLPPTHTSPHHHPTTPPRRYLIYINELVLRGTGPRRQRGSAWQSRRAGGWRGLRRAHRTATPRPRPGQPGGEVAAPPGALRSRPECFLAKPLPRPRGCFFPEPFDGVFRLSRSLSVPLPGVPARGVPSEGPPLAQAAALEHSGAALQGTGLKTKIFPRALA